MVTGSGLEGRRLECARVGPAFYRRRPPCREATRGEGLGARRHTCRRPVADATGPGAATVAPDTPRARTPRRLGLGAASGKGPWEGARSTSGRRAWGHGPAVRHARRGAGAPGAPASATSRSGSKLFHCALV
jgi:hypothetical protein